MWTDSLYSIAAKVHFDLDSSFISVSVALFLWCHTFPLKINVIKTNKKHQADKPYLGDFLNIKLTASSFHILTDKAKMSMVHKGMNQVFLFLVF